MAVAGFLGTQGGSINLLGAGAFNPAVHRGRISILPQDSELPCESYPLETLVHYGRLQGLSRSDAKASALSVLREVHLTDRMNAPIRTLSHGMRKRVMVAQCFLGAPEVVLLDEPLSGLDPREVANMRRFITAKAPNQTIVISSHNLHDLELLCDYIVFIKAGKTARTASTDEITGRTNLLRYTLAAPAADPETITGLPPEITLVTEDDPRVICCRFSGARYRPEEINALIIPKLLATTGVVSVERGASLEKQALNEM
jgi:ABC-2 type transport system ATP-binding protein